MKNTFGASVTVTLFGESHGEDIGAVLDGLAPGIEIKREYIEHMLTLRRPDGKISTPRKEKDDFRIVSGVINGGSFFGTGASNMAQTFDQSSQGVIAVSVGNQSAGTKITLSDSVKVINGTSFTGCTELKFNKVENGLYLGTEANPYMVLIELDIHTVEDFKLNKDTKIIAKTAFAKCTLLEDISFEGTEADWQAIIKPADWNGDLTVNVTCSDKMITVLG